MEYNYYLTYQMESGYEECSKKGECSQNPSLVFLHEVVISYLQELSFYLLKLKNIGITNEKIKEDFIEGISGIIVNIDYSQEQFYKIISKLYSNLLQAREIYFSVCNRNHLEIEVFKSSLKNPQKFNLSDAIIQGQKLFAKKYKKLKPKEMRLFELLVNVVKSICIHLIELKELGIDDEKTYEALLVLFSMKSSYKVFLEKINEILREFVELDHSLLQNLYEIREKIYGKIQPTKVSTSTKPNKAILVSGSNLRELELVLEATKNKGIDIYTHGHMLQAHSYPKLKAYSHLAGHFGGTGETYLLDFAEFPGAILITKHSFQRIETLYRSRIFTTDVLAPKGIVNIVNHNFEPLIESALNAKGFTKIKEKQPIVLNLSERKILEKISDVSKKIEEGKIKYFFAIGVSDKTKAQEEYFKKFLNLLGDDCFVFSFSYSNNKNNVLQVHSDYKFPILYKAYDVLTRKISLKELNPIALFTRCEPHSISNVLYMKFIGVEKIYFADCSPLLANPASVNALREIYDIKNYTNPEDDLKDMLK